MGELDGGVPGPHVFHELAKTVEEANHGEVEAPVV